MFWDVSAKKKEEELIRYRAYYDTLTDLPNRHRFELDFAEEINNDQTFTILYIDLEGLKEINESYGRHSGDIVLMKVGARLSGSIGHQSLIYRISGDEFSAVFPGQLEEDALKEIAERVTKTVSTPIYTSNTTVHVNLNIGVVSYPNDGVEMEMLLRHADLAMNHAKKSNAIYKRYDR
jgi:diguanylate cyclase (GGDEF)-like protein